MPRQYYPSCSFLAPPREVREPNEEVAGVREFLTRKLDQDETNLPDDTENHLIEFLLEKLSEWRVKNYKKMYQNEMQDDGENLSRHFDSFNEFYSGKLGQLRDSVEILGDRYKKSLKCHCTLVAKFLAIKLIVEEELLVCAKKYNSLFEELEKNFSKKHELEMRPEIHMLETQLQVLRNVQFYDEEIDIETSPYETREIAEVLFQQAVEVQQITQNEET